MTLIRTRFAPSPTGYLHLGSARTALFNWAFARHQGGEFKLRIEDTDLDRSRGEYEEAVLEGMRWLGLDWDGEVIRQSERRERHLAATRELLASGHAYRCNCSRESVEAGKQRDLAAGGPGTYDGHCRDLDLGPDCGEHTVRLRLPEEGLIGWEDAVFGPSGQDASQMGDAIIQRSDGTPLYNLAVVVDDIDMEITHVIRGADHQANCVLQLALYDALGAERPIMAHVPLIVDEQGKKLSKRRNNVSVQQFREEGYLQEALDNWIVRLGWSQGDNEFFSLNDLKHSFSLEGIGRSPAGADPAKLEWLNQHYIKELDSDDLFQRVYPHLEREAGRPVKDTPALRRLLDLLRERSTTLVQMATLARWQLREDLDYDEKAVKKHLKPAALPILESVLEKAQSIPEWKEDSLSQLFDDVSADHDDLKLGKIAQPVRVAVTGGPNSPGIFETLEVIGQARSLHRLEEAIALVQKRIQSAKVD
ncbi:MAG: glutamate--tRNA ligase [Deltaproteobacteria bacterium]|nr:glutamate--tRNA ligase [Deltaproteobacteria bacterium]